jgi:hypothetical protein
VGDEPDAEWQEGDRKELDAGPSEHLEPPARVIAM